MWLIRPCKYSYICLYRCYPEKESWVGKLFILHLLNVWFNMFSGDIFLSKRDFSFKEAKTPGLFAQVWHAHRCLQMMFSWSCTDFQLTILGSDNGLSPGRRQAIIWTNAGIMLIGLFGTNFIEILIKIHTLSFKKMYLKISSAKWRLFCLGLNELTNYVLSCWI